MNSALWLSLLALAGALAHRPGLASRLRPFWPLLLLASGAIAWYRVGLTLAALTFLALGGIGLLLAAAEQSRRLLRRSPAPPPSGSALTSTSAS
jgi:hypothetical protein